MTTENKPATADNELPALTPEEQAAIEKEADNRASTAYGSASANYFGGYVAGATLYARRGKRDRENAEEVLRAAIEVVKRPKSVYAGGFSPMVAVKLEDFEALESAIHKKPN